MNDISFQILRAIEIKEKDMKTERNNNNSQKTSMDDSTFQLLRLRVTEIKEKDMEIKQNNNNTQQNTNE